jgi:hypothetical protein
MLNIMTNSVYSLSYSLSLLSSKRLGPLYNWCTFPSVVCGLLASSYFHSSTHLKIAKICYNLCAISRIWGHSDGLEEHYLLGYNVVTSAERQLTFRRNITPPYSGSDKQRESRWQAWKVPTDNTALHPTRLRSASNKLDLRFSRGWLWRAGPSGVHCQIARRQPDVSEDHIALVSRVEM